MLTVHHLSFAFNLQTILDDVTFSVNRGERVALVGPNGCGKTTLLRLIAGDLPLQGGYVSRAAGLQIGYLSQGFELDPDLLIGRLLGEAAGDAAVLEAQLATLALQLVERPDDDGLQLRFDRLLQRIESSAVGALAAIVDELGLSALDPQLPLGRLSGGQKTRLALALVLLQQPDLLILDEPTNHLDIGMIEWLEQWSSAFDGGVLFVSHDRLFIDRVATHVLTFAADKHKVRLFSGNYSDYVDQLLVEQEKQLAAYRDQVYEVRRMRQAAQRERDRAMQIHRSTTPRQPHLRMKAKRAMKRAKAKEQRLEQYLESDERVEKPSRSWQMKVSFDDSSHLGRSVVHLADLSVGYDRPLLHVEQVDVAAGRRIVITGANGLGKTTLLRTIAGRLPPLGGRVEVGASVKLGYMTQEQRLIDPKLSPLALLEQRSFGSETEIRNYLHFYLFKDDEPLKPAAQLSFGQRARLALALLVADGCNVLLLDEPINHLDIPSRELFEQALLQFEGSTLAVVHDRYFIDRFAEEVWWVGDGRVQVELLA